MHKTRLREMNKTFTYKCIYYHLNVRTSIYALIQKMICT